MAGICRLRTAALPLAQRLSLAPSRAYGAAAAAACDYDYYEEDEYEMNGDRLPVPPMKETEGSIPGRGVKWVFIGNPSAKKHVYAERLSKLLEVPHISMGSLIRQELNPLFRNPNRESLIANAMNQGKLVPEDIIFGLLSKRLEEGYYRGETGFILEGIPRTRIQAEILDQIADLDLVVNFKCTKGCLVTKHIGSGICPHCRESLSMSNSSSISLNMPSQHTQLKSSTADTEGAKEEKVRIYAEQSKPLEDYYRKQKKLLDFQVASASGETWQGLLAALHLQHMNAIHPSQKLTV
ncbi:hypothetical protein HHK36_025143 [Tetracentron sinense]|uniref:adenylate kinase n=1 Tax=Tetracentron sinense TaxID=13715 RepID=A0A835D5C4_TETSI|nr:hypothetical protein HHK36_025143 [Tetracentron sinense]